VVSVPDPGRREREEQCAATLEHLTGYDELDEHRRLDLVERFTAYTEGLSLAAIAAAGQVALDQAIPAEQVEEAVRFVRSANSKSPWNEPRLRVRISGVYEELTNAVLGQARAIRKVADVLARAAIGLSGAYSSSQPTRPQGVLFLAGPTGVGKTEVAKKIAEIVFGRAEAMIRFDMSEFAAENSEARLLGAPPGYIGHQAGGELTNAVRRRPFCLLLFDEIEKAHPRILDKFLQILEDGRLTDSAGSTVHFTETLIVFTSNLGTSPMTSAGRTHWARSQVPGPRIRTVQLRPGAEYHQIDEQVRAEIRSEFRRLGRPELLNRIGDNIVVFDFISPKVACEILHRHLAHLTERVLTETGNTVKFATEVMRDLEAMVTDSERLVFGGRGVGSVVESRVLNPLARQLLALPTGMHLDVSRIWEDEAGAQLELVER
jgi:ATP-dependent Clp protease ATP-binding subunit ClpA